MGKKINKKLDAAENPIYTETSHNHLATCDFRAGIIYHYFDGVDSQRLLDAHKIKKSEESEDLGMIAKKQFKKNWMTCDWELTNSDFDVIMDVKRNLNGVDEASRYRNKLINAIDGSMGIVSSARVDRVGNRPFGYIAMAIGILCDSKNEAMEWLEKSVEYGYQGGEVALLRIINDLKSDCFILGGDGYIVDYEGYLHPYDDEGVNMDFESSIKAEEKMLGQLMYGFSKENSDMLVRWLTEHNIISKK